VDKVVIHKQYEQKKHDIALVRLSKDVEFQKNVRTICLPVFDHQRDIDPNYAAAKRLSIAGWGKTFPENSGDVLQKTIVDYLEQEDCVARFENASRTHKRINLTIRQDQICAVGRNRSDA
jgi:hypothetical protein